MHLLAEVWEQIADLRALIVSVLEGVANLLYDIERSVWLEISSLDHALQIRAVDQFHDEIREGSRSRFRCPEIVNRDDVRMIQFR